VYYKKAKSKEWQGPGTVLGQDGAQVLVKTGARTLMKVHPCKLILRQTAEQQINSRDQTTTPIAHEVTQISKEKMTIPDDEDSDSDDDEPRVTNPSLEISKEETEVLESNNIDDEEVVIINDDTAEIPALAGEEVLPDTTNEDPDVEIEDNRVSTRLRSRSASNNQMKKGDVIYVKNGDDWLSCSLIDKEGVSGNQWKVANVSGERFIVDLNIIEWLKTKETPHKEEDAVIFANVLKDEEIWLNTSRPTCNEEEKAMEKEIKQWKEFDVYEEVDRRNFPDQEVLACRWVINQKQKPDGLCTKARLVIKGFQETATQISDSPTAGKCVTRIFIMLANMLQYKLVAIDVRAAFLQSNPLDRLILVKPPKEQRTDANMVWRLKKGIYGLNDAARQWYLTVKNELLQYGCVQMPLDSSVFVYYTNGEFSGFLAVHVDDFLGAGSEEFHDKVIRRLKEKFQIGTEDEGEFTYVGWNIKQSMESKTVTVDQIDYQATINPITISAARKNQPDYELSELEKSEFQQLLGKLQWITSQSRPDLRYKVLESSTRASKPTVNDLLSLNVIVKKLKKTTVTIMFPSLSSDISQLKIYAYADASLNMLPDRISSARGHTIFLVSGQSAGILSWCSRKIKKVTKTIIYAEAMALSDCLDEAQMIRECILTAMCLSEKKTKETVPIIGLTDNLSLQENIYGTHQAEDLKLRIQVAYLKKTLEDEEINKIVWIPDPQQLADCLTKNPKNKNPVDNLLAVIQTGRLDIHPINH